jgi:hypothetical protein
MQATHVGQIKQPDALAHRAMLGQNALVLDRHGPATERDQACASGQVERVEGRTAKLA